MEQSDFSYRLFKVSYLTEAQYAIVWPLLLDDLLYDFSCILHFYRRITLKKLIVRPWEDLLQFRRSTTSYWCVDEVERECFR